MKAVFFLLSLFCLAGDLSCVAAPFVTVRGGQFFRGETPYYYIGTNLWYAPILGSTEKAADRARLLRELDSLHALGIDNLRMLVGADEGSRSANTVQPVLQSDRGKLNDRLLAGLDFVLAEMRKRDMLAVIYLTNAWDWSGGFGSYLRRVGLGDSPNAEGEGYNDYVRYAAQFATNEPAHRLYYAFIEKILTRTNRYTKQKYAADPTIMAWQLCNEPRPFGKDRKEAYAAWLHEAAVLVKKLAPKQLLSTGSEGLYGSEVDMQLCEQVHTDPLIDYLTVHVWPANWGWANRTRLWEDLPNVYVQAGKYIDAHQRLAQKIVKPYVIEEFGYPRDGYSFSPQATTQCRDAFYSFILGKVVESRRQGGLLAGTNFWGWGGEAVPQHERWQAGDPYLCDPSHEPQGWYSVFQTDSTTLAVISKAVFR